MRRVLVLLFVFALAGWSQQTPGAVKGQVTDSSGAVVPGAVITVAGGGAQKRVSTDALGNYAFTGLAPGTYTVRAVAPGFAAADRVVEVAPARAVTADIGLQVALETQQVTVQADATPTVSTEASNNAGQLVLKNEDLDALPDDPDDLEADLQALAGPSAGPNGGQIYIDGFTNARLPPKASIREIRINQNPFSAEFDRLGFGRIEIFTKPGTDKLRGQVFFNSGDAIFNSRNPFAPNRPDFNMRQYGGNLSGPLGKRASFFMDFEKRDIDDNALINATTLDQTALEPTLFREAVVTPQRRTTLSPRVDYQLSTNHTLTLRYTFTDMSHDNMGVGQYSLPSRAYSQGVTQHTIQATETAVVSTHVINETRFHFRRDITDLTGDNSQPAINVLDSFQGGGAQIGLSSNTEDDWEVQNYTSLALGAHAVKAGFRVRGSLIHDISPQNFGGTFTFSGGFAPVLDANNQPVLDANGNPEIAKISSIERYRRTLLFDSMGLPASEIRRLGGGASQFSIAAGNPLANVSQWDWGPFVQDDWRALPNFTLSMGLRYEGQTNIHDWKDVAPRLGFAWAPGGTGRKNGKTVIRGGFGMFYDRFSDSLVLQAIRFNGSNQQQYIAMNPDFFPNVPPLTQFTATQAQTTREIANSLRAPAIVQAAIGIERQLPWNTTIASTFTFSRATHLLRSRNINAPLPGTVVPGQGDGGIRPYGGDGNIYLYESSGQLKQNQWMTNVRSNVNRYVSLFAFYVLNHANSDTDGASTFPANPYDLSTEWSRAAIDIRHRFVLGGSFVAPYGLRLSPFVMVHSGAPFNITTGRDANGDTVFADRPAFATDPNKPGVVATPWGLLDPNPGPGETIIPRNFGQSPGYVAINLRVSRTWGFGERKTGGGAADMGGFGGGGPHGGGPHGGGPGAMRMGGGPMRGMFDGSTNRRYNLTLAASARNILNHTNPGMPVGNMTSPFFLQSTSIDGGWGPSSAVGNRRMELSLRFTF